MAQYIGKDALVAEINKLHKAHSGKYGCDEVGLNLEYLEDFINTLEVKEVDLEKEIQAFAKIELEPIKIYDANVGITITMHQLYQCAKHFFELGLKTQEEEL